MQVGGGLAGAAAPTGLGPERGRGWQCRPGPGLRPGTGAGRRSRCLSVCLSVRAASGGLLAPPQTSASRPGPVSGIRGPTCQVLFPSTVGEPRAASVGRAWSAPLGAGIAARHPRAAAGCVTLRRRRGAEGCGREQTIPLARPFLRPHVTLVSSGSRSCSRSQGCAEPARSAPRLRPHGPPPLSVSTQPLLALKRHRSALNPGWLCLKIFD